MKPFMADLARLVHARDHGCSVQFLKDGRIADARWSQSILRRGIVVRPCHFVVVVTREAEPTMFEVVWRGAAVATVTSGMETASPTTLAMRRIGTSPGR
jgi:hypothetical protein